MIMITEENNWTFMQVETSHNPLIVVSVVTQHTYILLKE